MILELFTADRKQLRRRLPPRGSCRVAPKLPEAAPGA